MRLQPKHRAFFPFPDDPEKSEYEFKHLRAGAAAKITQATTSQRFEMRIGEDGETAEPVSVLESNRARQRQESAYEALVAWKNQYDQDGIPMEFTPQNKRRFFKELSKENYAAFLNFYEECAVKLAEQVKEQEEARLGN